MKIKNTDLLLIVDVQNDFVTGSLAVPNAKDIMPVINKYIEKFKYVLFSRERHSIDHCSFVAQGGPWPPHCVEDTYGAELHSGLNISGDIFIIEKGTLVDKEAYSAFESTKLLKGTLRKRQSHSVDSFQKMNIIVDKLDISTYLRLMDIKRLFICGLATDYCVKNTVLDATKNKKFNGSVFLLMDAIKAVEVAAGDGDKAVGRMVAAGAIPTCLDGSGGINV